jgi:hypothetical protein
MGNTQTRIPGNTFPDAVQGNNIAIDAQCGGEWLAGTLVEVCEDTGVCTVEVGPWKEYMKVALSKKPEHLPGEYEVSIVYDCSHQSCTSKEEPHLHGTTWSCMPTFTTASKRAYIGVGLEENSSNIPSSYCVEITVPENSSPSDFANATGKKVKNCLGRPSPTHPDSWEWWERGMAGSEPHFRHLYVDAIIRSKSCIVAYRQTKEHALSLLGELNKCGISSATMRELPCGMPITELQLSHMYEYRTQQKLRLHLAATMFSTSATSGPGGSPGSDFGDFLMRQLHGEFGGLPPPPREVLEALSGSSGGMEGLFEAMARARMAGETSDDEDGVKSAPLIDINDVLDQYAPELKTFAKDTLNNGYDTAELRQKFSSTLEHNKSDLHCSMCQEHLAVGSTVMTLPSCGHVFHAEASDDCVGVLGWFKDNHTCPDCRAPFEKCEAHYRTIAKGDSLNADGTYPCLCCGEMHVSFDGDVGDAKCTKCNASHGAAVMSARNEKFFVDAVVLVCLREKMESLTMKTETALQRVRREMSNMISSPTLKRFDKGNWDVRDTLVSALIEGTGPYSTWQKKMAKEDPNTKGLLNRFKTLLERAQKVVLAAQKGQVQETKEAESVDIVPLPQLVRSLSAALDTLDLAQYKPALKENGYKTLDHVKAARVDDLVQKCGMNEHDASALLRSAVPPA